MSGFSNAVDIANRGLQHIGVERIDATAGFTEDSKQAAECSFVYPKLRQAELRRNYWRFAIKKTALRPVDDMTKFLKPSLWSAQTTYYRGSIVADDSGTLWISNTPDNLNNDPQNTSLWDLYFGPLSVHPYDPTTSYFSGELVYAAPGDGTYSVFMALESTVVDNPQVPREWGSAVIYDKNQVVEFAPAWAAGTTYAQGAMVTYTDGLTYVSLTAGNIGNIPKGDTTHWIALPTTLDSSTAAAILEWDVATTYSKNDFVDVNGTRYLSIIDANLANPPATSAADWVALTGGVIYSSLIDLNLNNEPDLAPAIWDAATTYASGTKVGGSDGVIYQSTVSGNIGHDPTTDGGAHWTNTDVLNPWTSRAADLPGTGSLKWLKLPSPVLSDLMVQYPLGSGPLSQTITNNIYRLPANYLREAPQQPKAGSTSLLGAPSNLVYDDWEFDGPFVVTACTTPIVFRFVADVADVTAMDPMFCEGLAARIGMEVCEPLAQSTAKKQAAASEYQKFMGEARLVGSIEEGPVEQPLDDLLACRL